jgi:hypothetical protein
LLSARRQEIGSQLSLDQLKEIEVGPQGEKAVGVTVAKMFDKDKFFGKVDSFRTVRQRIYYHVVYTDGGEEEMTQLELRNAYVLGLSDVINAQWKKYKISTGQLDSNDKDEASEIDSSDGSGSDYDNRDFNAEVRQIKRQRRQAKRSKKKSKNDLSVVVLPSPGDKTVAAEAFLKLSVEQKKQVAAKVNKHTKKVHPQSCTIHISLFQILFHLPSIGCTSVGKGTNL